MVEQTKTRSSVVPAKPAWVAANDKGNKSANALPVELFVVLWPARLKRRDAATTLTTTAMGAPMRSLAKVEGVQRAMAAVVGLGHKSVTDQQVLWNAVHEQGRL
jgi:hypothetical protein